MKATATILRTEIRNSTLMATCHIAHHTWPRTKGLRTGTLKISAFTLRQHLSLTGAVSSCHCQRYHAHKEQATFSLVSQPCQGMPPARGWGCRRAAKKPCMSPSAGPTCQGWIQGTDAQILQTDEKLCWTTALSIPSITMNRDHGKELVWFNPCTASTLCYQLNRTACCA